MAQGANRNKLANEATEIKNANWENSPANSDALFRGSGNIRETRSEIKRALSQEHEITTVEDGDTIGTHVLGSARCYVLEDSTDDIPLDSDTSKGRMRFYEDTKKFEIRSSSAWVGVAPLFPGLITMSAVEPNPVTDGWALCDGTTVTETDDGGIYKNLIKALDNTATTVNLPDLRDQFIRGASSTRAVLTSQEHAFQNHTHLMDHTHGADMTNGVDTGNGRTGTGTWNTGTFTREDDGEHAHKFEAVIRRDADINAGAFTRYGRANSPQEGTTKLDGESKHSHAIERYYGLTKKAGNAALVDYNVPENEYNTDDNETRPDNIALYFVIKL